jgi:hydroxypyruvate reductase
MDRAASAVVAVARRLVPVVLAAVEPEGRVRSLLAGERGAIGRSFTAALALGKAGAALARGAESALAPGAPRLLVRPVASARPAVDAGRWEEWLGGHPLPDAASVAAGRRLAALLADLGPGDRLLALISGGGSACLELPVAPLTLNDLVATQRLLLAAGLPIDRVNAVRSHLSALKGGGALAATSARVTVLVVSDVPGDRLEQVASGPFGADPTTFADALAAVEKLPVPAAVAAHLAAGARGEVGETVKPGDRHLDRLEPPGLRLLAGNDTAVRSAVAQLGAEGLRVETAPLVGEAAVAGGELVARGRRLSGQGVAVVAGGETTVHLPGGGSTAGRGGRCQELALAAARALAGGRGEAVLALATDGVDGPTEAAGAIVDADTWQALAAAGADPSGALRGHDSATALGALPEVRLVTGPTGTNVADLAVYLRHG